MIRMFGMLKERRETLAELFSEKGIRDVRD